MKKINNIVAGTLLLLGSVVFAQQESAFTMYPYHMNGINPAYVGMDGETVVVGTIRNQWTGIPEAPLTQEVSFGTPINKNIGLGFSITNDRTFVEKQTFVGIDFSYKLQMSSTLDLYFGLKAGGNFYSLNTSGLESYGIQSDPALASYSNFNPNVGLGMVFKSEKYYVSFSVPRMLSVDRAKNEAGYAMQAVDRPHFYLSGGYDFDLNSRMTSLVLKPSMLLRYVGNSPVSVDFSTMLQIAEMFEIGAMYRTDQTMAMVTNFTINKSILIGYAYEWSTISAMGSASSTNELLLRYKF